MSSIPAVLLGAGKAPAGRETQPRPAAVFHPSVWGDHFLAYTSADMEVDVNKERKLQQLKEKVRKQLVEAEGECPQQLDLIDAIQRLRVAYHFETEIDIALHHMYETYLQHGDKKVNNEDLYTLSLWFRLLRQQGYRVSCDVFKKIKDNEGNFKESLIGDVRGLLSLYEATHLRVHGEDILDEALDFTTTHLNSAIPKLSNHPIAAQVVHAVNDNQPIHKGLPRLESRHFISLYEKNDSHDKFLLDFAKLDFNLLQKLHQRELREITRWWNDLDVARNFPFARDRVAELYFWMLGVYYEPQYFPAIRILTKVVCFISIIDDIFDASNATIEELVLFHDAIQRSEVSALDQLPDYMNFVYQKLMDTYNMINEEMAKQGRSYRVEYAKSAMKGLVGVYLTEAKWCHEGYVPSMEEHTPVAYLSGALQALSAVSFVGMGELATKEAFDWIFSWPLIVQASSAVTRLMNDMVSHEFEQERGHVASAVECYMKQYGATKEETFIELQKRVTNAWKDINSECLRPTAVPMPLLMPVLNLARSMHVMYKDGADSYTRSQTNLKEFVTSVLVDSVPT